MACLFENNYPNYNLKCISSYDFLTCDLFSVSKTVKSLQHTKFYEGNLILKSSVSIVLQNIIWKSIKIQYRTPLVNSNSAITHSVTNGFVYWIWRCVGDSIIRFNYFLEMYHPVVKSSTWYHLVCYVIYRSPLINILGLKMCTLLAFPEYVIYPKFDGQSSNAQPVIQNPETKIAHVHNMPQDIWKKKKRN